MSDEQLRPAPGDEEPTLREPDPEIEDVVFPELGNDVNDVDATEDTTLDRLMDVSMTVTVELGRREMLIQDVLNLGHGSILELDRNASEPIDILVNGKLLAKGEVVVVGENFGVRLTSLVDASDRARRVS